MHTMKRHKDAISGVKWSDKTEIVTSSWDHTVKIWDSELGSVKREFIGEKSYFDVDYSSLAHALITASADRHVRLYDPRSSGTGKAWHTIVLWNSKLSFTFFKFLLQNNATIEVFNFALERKFAKLWCFNFPNFLLAFKEIKLDFLLTFTKYREKFNGKFEFI